ncbi:hypothetical protein IWQ62_003173 [Dispira parvispora]|uniref:Uncharacterized protein n=1 Tax=Dispira parvispora TaxID=1520584 RepID=A0A9W8ANZ1_9FUNG|nr:hypothetical protein IWQ62_003173 [Dispira parvispora]
MTPWVRFDWRLPVITSRLYHRSPLHCRLLGTSTPRTNEASPTRAELEAEIYKPWYKRNFNKPAYQNHLRQFIALTILGSLAINAVWDRVALEDYLQEAEEERAQLQSQITTLERQLGIAEPVESENKLATAVVVTEPVMPPPPSDSAEEVDYI